MSGLKEMGETGIIQLFQKSSFSKPVVLGIGDDCAVFRMHGEDLAVWTTDMLMEDVHFRRVATDARRLGAKCMSVNLSDIAAMGAKPMGALIAVSLPKDVESVWLRLFRDGFTEIAEEYGCQIIGGDTCRSIDRICISVTVIGLVSESEILYRSGAKDGDDIWVSGVPGLSTLGFQLIEKNRAPETDIERQAIERHRCPKPRITLGMILSKEGHAHACIDTSDGISQDLLRIAQASGLSAVIETELLTSIRGVDGLAADPLKLALHGGEDYELLFTASRRHRSRLDSFAELNRIGFMESGPQGLSLLMQDGSRQEVRNEGFSHF